MIELASVISGLRDEMERAIVASEGEVLRFELGQIELEVSIAVERSKGAEGGVSFWVVELGAKGKKAASDTQRIKLALTPRIHGTTDSVYIGGHAEPGEEE